MKNKQFVKIPFAILEMDIDSTHKILWAEIKRFPNGRAVTNKSIAKALGLSVRKTAEMTKELIQMGLLEKWEDVNRYGTVRFLKAINPSGKEEPFVKTPFELLDTEIDTKSKELWIHLRKFKKGNTFVNKELSRLLNTTVRTIGTKLNVLKENKLVDVEYKVTDWGWVRHIKAILPDEKQKENLSWKEYHTKYMTEAKFEGRELNVNELMNNYKKLVKQND